ncbi:MAG: OsmC family protein [Burkholderiales bacterium]
MSITVTRNRDHRMAHDVRVRAHRITVDEPPAVGGDDLGPTPHDLFDSAVAACKALTVVWYANRKAIPLEDVEVVIDRDDTQERQGVYQLRASLRLGGPLTDAQRAELLAVAGKCPVHKLVTQVKTEIVTVLAEQ